MDIIIDENDCKKINFDNNCIYYYIKNKIYCEKKDKKFYRVRECKKCDNYLDFKRGCKLCDNCIKN
jgi:hypothetical protein